MHEAYLLINGVRTKITTFGKWVEESFNEIEDIVIIIPGNPGVNGFYNKFGKIIHDKLGYPVWCIGHAGHNLPKQPISPLPKLKGHEDLYGLQGQLQSKAEFFEKYIPNNARIHLIGHSIGAYMALELLEHPSIKDKVSDVYLLFPTIEYMAETENGKILTNFVKHIVWFLVFLSWLFTFFPKIMQNILLTIYMAITGIPKKDHRSNIKSFIKPGVLKRTFYMAYQEMDQVKKRNDDVIKRNVGKIRLYYSESDGWAPRAYYERIKKDIPNVDAQISTFEHAFVLRQCEAIGNIVCDWIKAKN